MQINILGNDNFSKQPNYSTKYNNKNAAIVLVRRRQDLIGVFELIVIQAWTNHVHIKRQIKNLNHTQGVSKV